MDSQSFDEREKEKATLWGVKDGLSQSIKVVEARMRALEEKRQDISEDFDSPLSKLIYHSQQEVLEEVRAELLERFKTVFSDFRE